MFILFCIPCTKQRDVRCYLCGSAVATEHALCSPPSSLCSVRVGPRVKRSRVEMGAHTQGEVAGSVECTVVYPGI